MTSLYSGTDLTFYKHLHMYFTHSNLCRAREDRHTYFTDKEIKFPEDCGLVTCQFGAGTQNSQFSFQDS